MDKAFPGMGHVLLVLGNAAQDFLTKGQLEEAKNSDNIFEYLVNTLNRSSLAATETATGVEHDEAHKTGKDFADIATTLATIRDGILVKILAALQPLASWLMVIAKGILANTAFKGRFDSMVAALDAADHEKNVAALAANTIHLRTLEASVPVLAEKLGYTTPEQRQAVMYRFEKYGEIPGGLTTQKQLDEFFNYIGQEQSLRLVQETNKKLTYETTKYRTGSAESLTKPGEIDRYEIGSTVVVPNASAGQVAIKASDYIQKEAFDIALAADEMIVANGPVSRDTLVRRAAEIEREREELKHTLENSNHIRQYWRPNTPEEVEEALQVYDNRNAQELATLQWLYILGKDGTPARPGEARTYLNELSRREQLETAAELTAIEAVKAQMPHLFDALLEGKMRIEGGPSENKREYTIRLIDTETGKEYTIRDVYNAGGGTQSLGESNIDFRDFSESPLPTSP
jgi:hypothetical protein